MAELYTRFGTALWFLACVLVALFVFAQYGLGQAPLTHDMSLQMYSAQLLARGLPPYVSVGLVKTPLTGMLGAVMVLVGSAFGVWDVLAVRVGFWFLMALGAGGIFLWVRALYSSRVAALLAALTLVSADVVGINAVLGPQPKTLVMVAAIYTLYLSAQARWFWAGICAALGFLAWQPAAILIAIVAVMPLIDPGGERRAAWGRAVLGVAVPLLAVVVYLAAQGALSAALQDAFGANLAYLENAERQTPLAARLAENADKIVRRAGASCYSNRVVFGVGLLGLAGVVVLPLVQGKARELGSRRVLPVLLYTALFVGFSLVDFQVCDDLMPLAPVLALGIGFIAAALVKWVEARLPGRRLRAGAAVVGVILFFLATSAWVWFAPRLPNITLQEQTALAAEITRAVGPDDEIQQLGDAVLLVFLKKQNPTKLIFFGPKTGTGILEQIPSGIEGVIAGMEADPPKLIALSHVRPSDWSQTLRAWIGAHYQKAGEYPMFGEGESLMQVYVRRSD